jgi:signal peptide peptidase SppA
MEVKTQLKTPSSYFLGRPLAMLPSAVAQLEELLAAGPSAASARLASTVPAAGPGVRVINMDGPVLAGLPDWLMEAIGAVDASQVAAQVAAAAADPDVTGIVLMVNSPGGMVSSGIDEAATAIRAANTMKPVIAYAPNLAASAAYWMISGARVIVTSSTGLIGSIGTYLRWTDFSGAAEQQGVQVHVYRSAPGKAPGQPGEPHSEHVDEALATMVDDTNAVFVQGVALGRGLPIATVQDRLATGRVWVGEQAVAAGVADQLGTFADAVRLAGGSITPSQPRRAASHTPIGGKMTPEQLAALGLSAEATPQEIQAALDARNQAQTQHASLTNRITAGLALAEGADAPADPLATLTAQAADGRAYREAQLDRLASLVIVTEGNDPKGQQAAADAREVYASQPLDKIAAQITRLEAKREELPNGPRSQHSSPDTKPKQQNLSRFGVGRR